jgi:hypothetical protein
MSGVMVSTAAVILFFEPGMRMVVAQTLFLRVTPNEVESG